MKLIIKISFLVAVILIGGCKKLVEVESPLTKFDASKVYAKDENAISVLTALYQAMSADGIMQGANSISAIGGLSADELVEFPGFSEQRFAVYQNNLTPMNAPLWGRLYFFVYTANTAIEGINRSTTLSPIVKDRLLGEAKFMRAFAYFFLVNFWGDVPLLTSNNYEINRSAERASHNSVFKQIIADLLDANGLLSSEYLLSDLKTSTNERIRPNKWVALSLLSRVYLYVKDYASAERIATEIIDQNNIFSLSKINEVFLMNSSETIWRIQSIDPSWNTFDAKAFIIVNQPNFNQPMTLSENLTNSFEDGDGRKNQWVGSITTGGQTYKFPWKYKSNIQNAMKTESLIVFRLAEQFLIRAEARNELGKKLEAISDLNTIRDRARLAPTIDSPVPLPQLPISLNKEEVMSAVMKERKIELFTEWGHRWFDLKRTDQTNRIMGITAPSKGTQWNPFRANFPIPQDELTYNSKIVQNQGYN